MSKTIIVWFRADLRVTDHPALAAAAADADKVVPVFIYDDNLLKKAGSSNRNRFLLECVEDVKQSLKKKGGDLVVRHGQPSLELQKLAQETDATAVYAIEDFTVYARSRDKKVSTALKKHGIELTLFPGKLIIDDVKTIKTKTGNIYKVFTPFWKQWSQVERRDIASSPRAIALPSVRIGSMPSLDDLTTSSKLSPDVLIGGETEARKRFQAFVSDKIGTYHKTNNDLAADGTSRLSSYLHFGCLSPRELESLLPDSQGADAWHRQLAWRDFYHYVLYHFPNPGKEFQERYRSLAWNKDAGMLRAWKKGETGFPVVDAAMRQLIREGWMHNRARLIVGSFLTKDLGIDWREGERHFMDMLIDGDAANNNGNWQWIASVGVDPAPLFRRLYNPSSQRDKYDPTGEYVRRYVPELSKVPDSFLTEPWTMSDQDQQASNCKIGVDYPKPVVDHKQARQESIERYKT